MSSQPFTIDVDARTITIPPEFTNAGVQSDHNALTIYFEIGRTYDGEDLSTHSVAIPYINAKGEKDIYNVTNIDLNTPDKIIFSWELSNHVTRYAGTVSFAVMFYSIQDNVYTYKYNTEAATMTISDGIVVGIGDVTVKPDILELIPNVPSWALQPEKPTYTAAEVNALPDTTTIPTKISDLTDDGNFVHKTGAETIGGVKTFADNVFTQNLIGGNTIYGGSYTDNLDNIEKSGFYTISYTSVGAPSVGTYSWFVLHQNGNSNTTVATQRAIAIGSNLIVCERVKVNSVWGSWVLQVSRSEFDALSSNFSDPLSYTQLTSNVEIRAYKDKTGVVFMDCYVLSEIPAGSTIFTVPPDFIPSEQVAKSFWLPLNSSTWGTHYITINTNGNIITNNAIYRGNLLFIYQK